NYDLGHAAECDRDKLKHLTLALLAGSLLTPASASVYSGCTAKQASMNLCNVQTENTGSELVLSAPQTRGSTKNDTGSRSAERSQESAPSRNSSGPSRASDRTSERSQMQGAGALGAECGGRLGGGSEDCEVPASPPSGGAFTDRIAPAVSISDVARFAPSAPAAQMEPSGQA